MKPTSLKAGDQVECGGRVLTFIRRGAQSCKPAVNVLQGDDYRGLDGPTDDGRCTMSDYDLSRNCERLAAQPVAEACRAV